MGPEHRPDESAIREQAYYLWEQDGRPEGRDMEYWQRATVAVTERGQLSTLIAAPPKQKRKAKELKAATAPAKTAPAKTSKARNEPKAKPKKA